MKKLDNKLSRKEVCEILNLNEKDFKKKFRKLGIKSQKRRSPKSWEKLLSIEINL